MGDFSNYAEQGMQYGRLVEYEVTELKNPDGTHPILDVEHIGSTNASLMEEALSRAKAADQQPPPVGVVATLRENIDQVIKHSARHLRNAVFSDGRPASDADLPAFIKSMPAKAFSRLLVFAATESNFCKYPIAETATALAEK